MANDQWSVPLSDHHVPLGTAIAKLRYTEKPQSPVIRPLICPTFLEYQVMHSFQGLLDPHAKVRWAACQALGQMCTDLGPELQSSQHSRVLPGLMAVMDDFSQPRVQARATH